MAGEIKFLKKSKREKLKKQSAIQAQADLANKKLAFAKALEQKKLQRQTRHEERPDESRQIERSKAAKKSSKFNFEWNQLEDTSGGYEPLVKYKVAENTTVGWDDKHWSEKPLAEMTNRDWRIFREDYEIGTRGLVKEHPLRSWAESEIPKSIVDVVHQLGYENPTPVQRATIPVALKNKDVLAIAETGSGKTLGFVIPALSYITRLPPMTALTQNHGPYVLILVPTRELAQQIHIEVTKFCKHLGYKSAAVYGGHQLETNSMDLQDGVEILIATPGRLLDCLERKILVLNQCFYLVMDEADRMIDLGFEIQVKAILDRLPSAANNRQASRIGATRNVTLMFTATMPSSIEKLVSNYLRSPSTVVIGNPGMAVDSVEQKAEFVSSDDAKNKRLLAVLRSPAYRPPIIIFVNYKKTCEDLRALIESSTRLKAVVIHGSKSQDQREAAIRNLRLGKYDVLVATDLAGRGIDIPDVSLVINYQMTKQIEDYVHRIGRTGRAGNTGTAMTFLSPEADQAVLYDLKNTIMKSSISKCPEELKRHPAAQVKQFHGSS